MHNKRLYILLGGAAVFVVIILIIALVQGVGSNQTNNDQVKSQQDYLGHLACLPHKNAQPGQPQTLECAIGLEGEDGNYYGLKDIPEDSKYLEFSQRLQVTGELRESDPDSNYDTVGDIQVVAIEILPTKQ